jgi:DNA-binding transcriptional regulator YiaG
MPNIASVLKEEISRVARKEVRRETAALKRASAGYRTEIGALKRRAQDLERHLRRMLKRAESVAKAANDEPASQGSRFSPKSLASQRRRLGLSAAECGLLLGASAQSIYNWEEGKARPRSQHLPAIFALRTIGRRQANAYLETIRQAA